MSLIKWSPFYDPFENMDKFFDGLPSVHGRGDGLVPAIDVYDKKDAVVIETALPGVDPKNVDVSVENGMLTISGTSQRKTEVDEKDYYRKEIRSGTFKRQVGLPQGVNESKANAVFKNGLLTIEIPKLTESKTQSVKIDVQND